MSYSNESAMIIDFPTFWFLWFNTPFQVHRKANLYQIMSHHQTALYILKIQVIEISFLKYFYHTYIQKRLKTNNTAH